LGVSLNVVALLGCRPDTSGFPRPSTAQLSPNIRDQIEVAYREAGEFPGDSTVVGRYAMLLHATNQVPAAIECYRRAEKIHPQNPAWPYLRGVAQAAGSPQEAADSFRSAIRLRSDFLPAQIRLGDALLAAGHAQAAAQVFRLLVERDATVAVAHSRLAAIHLQLGEPAKAAEHARLAVQHQDSPPAEDPYLDAILQLNAGPQPHLDRAAQLERDGRTADAASAIEKAMEIDPRLTASAPLHIRLLTLYGRLGFRERAEAHFREAVRLDPGLAEAHFQWAAMLNKLGEIAAAEKSFRETLRMNPRHPGAATELATLLIGRGQLDPAAALLRRALEASPGHRPALFQMARILAARNDLAGAIAHLERTLSPEDETTPGHLFALARLHERAGDSAKALATLERARDAAAARGQQQLLAGIADELLRLSRAPRP
jgi:tetratricopeptide (TPR) repeat protein